MTQSKRPRGRPRTVTEEQIARMIVLSEEGYTHRSIARHLNIGVASVGRFLLIERGGVKVPKGRKPKPVPVQGPHGPEYLCVCSHPQSAHTADGCKCGCETFRARGMARGSAVAPWFATFAPAEAQQTQIIYFPDDAWFRQCMQHVRQSRD